MVFLRTSQTNRWPLICAVIRRLGRAKLLLALLAWLALWLLATSPVLADGGDGGSGVTPQVISLPSGPGSLEGLGASFEPALSTGTASYPVALTVPPGTADFQPALTLHYDGGNPNGPWGLGWRLDVPFIQRHTDEGLPSYDDARDRFIFSSGEKLVTLSDGSYRFENESTFMRFQRLPGGGWEARSSDGTRHLFGDTDGAREITPRGVFSWRLERQIDIHGNEIHYVYYKDGDYAYLKEIHYNQAADGRDNAVVFSYERRPDVFTDRRSRAPITVTLRATEARMLSLGRLVRIYRFDYAAETATRHHSLLQRIRQIGDDGVSELPSTTFTYTAFDPAASTVVSMQNPPPIGLGDPDADLIDINGDGLPDVAYTPSDGLRFYLNRGAGRWQEGPIFPDISPPDRLSSPNARMADVDGDGRVDFLVKPGATSGSPFYYYAGRSGHYWEQSDRVDYNLAPGVDLDAPNLRLVDINNDKRVDLWLSDQSISHIWLGHDDHTWSETADVTFATPVVGTPLVFENAHVKLGDMTGDRIQDLVYVRDGLVVYFPHNGLGEFDPPVTMAGAPSDLGPQDVDLLLADVNNDGLDDLVLPANRSVQYWLNRGDGSFAEPVTIENTPAYNTETAVRVADVDGDGVSELLFSRYPAAIDEAYQYVDFCACPHPNLLASIDNGLGRTIHLEYQPSTAYYVADWDAGDRWKTTLPFPLQVVSRSIVHDANSSADYTIDFAYRDGYYDGEQKEFRGFARAVETQPGDATAATTVTRTVYDVGEQEESRKGLVLETEVLGVGGECTGDFAGCYQRQVNQLVTRSLDDEGPGRRVKYSFVSRTDTFVHEQRAAPVVLRQEFDRDRYGNPTREFNYGQVCSEDVHCGDDEVLTTTDYAINEPAWILNRPSHIVKTDATGGFVSEARLYYDGEPYTGLTLGQAERGDLARQEESLGPRGNGRFIPTRRQAFDGFGNVIGIKDANGNATTVEYDALTHTFPVLEQLRLGDGRSLAYAASYNHSFGTVTQATDYNGLVTMYTYDTFGHLASIVRPGDTEALPTEQYAYRLGSPRSAIVTERRERSGAPDMHTSIVYFDGLGRKLQIRSEAEEGRVTVSGAVTFDARGNGRDKYLPFYDTGFDYVAPTRELSHTVQYYDPQGRPMRLDNPDGTYTSVVHQPLVQVLYDEEDNRKKGPHSGTPKTLTYDGLDRLVAVEEINVVNGKTETYTTTYAYDGLGNLTNIMDVLGNQKTMMYDGLSRRVRMVDPDRGEMVFSYDDNGNLLQTRDAKNQIVQYKYDAANRITAEVWHPSSSLTETISTYHYDSDLSSDHRDARNTLGRLVWVADAAGAVYFSYDERGNMAGRIWHFAAEKLTFVTRMAYDASDRLTRLTYPDGTTIDDEYNAQGLLERIPGYATDFDYFASGQRQLFATADEVNTTYQYDSRLRMTDLHASDRAGTILQELHYHFDGVSNIVGIDDRRPGRTAVDDDSQSSTVDDLYRLTEMRYTAGTRDAITYTYDPQGNLTQQTSTFPDANLGILGYGQLAGPHAITQVRGQAWSYDANGNLTSKPGYTLSWDVRDRLVSIVSPNGLRQNHIYDYAGTRVVKRVSTAQGDQTVLYPDQVVEVRGNELVKYVYAGDQRVAEVRGPFDPTRLIRGFDGEQPATTTPASAGIVFYHPDYLGSSTLLTDNQGHVVERVSYTPYGTERARSGASPIAYRFTGQEQDAETGLYDYGARFYDPLVGRFISVDPLSAQQPEKGLDCPQTLNVYAYGLNNPVKYTDPTGQYVETAIDVLSIGYDIYDIKKNGLTWTSGLSLGADVASLALPFVTGGGAAVRAIAHADDVVDAMRAAEHVVDTEKAVNRVTDTVKAIEHEKTYITYIFKREEEVAYVGRASGLGTPEAVLKQRLGKGHHIFESNPGLKAEIKAVQGNRAANRGAEDVWYEYYRREGVPLLNSSKSPPLSSMPSKIERSRELIQSYANDLKTP